MTEWMEKKGYASINQLRGSMSQASVIDAAAFMRGNYIKTLESYTKTTSSTARLARLKLR
jgi:hypothetical protein